MANLLLRDPAALKNANFVLAPIPGMDVKDDGSGITKPAGKHAGAIIDLITSPEFIRMVDGGAFERHMAESKAEMRALGAVGKTTGALGMSKSGEHKWDGDCPLWLFQWLSHLDPEIMSDPKRQEKILRRIGGFVDERVK